MSHLFDKVFVVSLPRSIARREYITDHLPRFGFREFEFFDAIDAGDSRVDSFYRSGRVKGFPPCFRCGANDCGNPDCNNVLLPPQVATFLTFVQLWRHIAEGQARRVLIVEDDVKFESYAPTVLTRLEHAVECREIPFDHEKAIMLRLGWARCADHVDTGRLKASKQPRMSNPCHAMTRPFAQALLKRFARIDTTADIFLHAKNADVGTALTIFPPLASDLSWSDGSVPSEIHPKIKHADYLRRSGREDDARRYESLMTKHRKHIAWRPLVITGHPRCGSGFAADICMQLGLDVGHERTGVSGISSWMFAVDDDNPFFSDPLASNRKNIAWDRLILYVRDLRDAIPSVMREHEHAPPKAFDFLRKHILERCGADLAEFEDPIERAAWSIILWVKIITDQRPSFIFRVEDQADLLKDFLLSEKLVSQWRRWVKIRPKVVNANKVYRGVRYPKPACTWDEICARASPRLLQAMSDYDDFFGYPLAARR